MKFKIGDCVLAKNWAGDEFFGVVVKHERKEAFTLANDIYFIKWAPNEATWFIEYLVSPLPPEQWHTIKLKVFGNAVQNRRLCRIKEL